jgi:hypothetical protein
MGFPKAATEVNCLLCLKPYPKTQFSLSFCPRCRDRILEWVIGSYLKHFIKDLSSPRLETFIQHRIDTAIRALVKTWNDLSQSDLQIKKTGRVIPKPFSQRIRQDSETWRAWGRNVGSHEKVMLQG